MGDVRVEKFKEKIEARLKELDDGSYLYIEKIASGFQFGIGSPEQSAPVEVVIFNPKGSLVLTDADGEKHKVRSLDALIEGVLETLSDD